MKEGKYKTAHAASFHIVSKKQIQSVAVWDSLIGNGDWGMGVGCKGYKGMFGDDGFDLGGFTGRHIYLTEVTNYILKM